MKLGALLMPSHPPERDIQQGQAWDLEEIVRLDTLGFDEAWVGEHFTAAWEPCPAPDLLIARALGSTGRIRLGPLGHLLPYHHPVELAHRVAYLDHMAQGRYQLGVGISALPTDHDLFALDISGGVNRRTSRRWSSSRSCGVTGPATSTANSGRCERLAQTWGWDWDITFVRISFPARRSRSRA